MIGKPNGTGNGTHHLNAGPSPARQRTRIAPTRMEVRDPAGIAGIQGEASALLHGYRSLPIDVTTLQGLYVDHLGRALSSVTTPTEKEMSRRVAEGLKEMLSEQGIDPARAYLEALLKAAERPQALAAMNGAGSGLRQGLLPERARLALAAAAAVWIFVAGGQFNAYMAGDRGNNPPAASPTGGLYSVDGGPLSGWGYNWSNNPFYAVQHPAGALRNTAADGFYELTGGRYRP